MRIGDTLNHHIAKAARNGIQTVFHVIFLLKINLIAGTNIIATTQGRTPLKMLSTIALSLNDVKNIAMSKIATNDGSAAPNAETNAPRLPRSRPLTNF